MSITSSERSTPTDPSPDGDAAVEQPGARAGRGPKPKIWVRLIALLAALLTAWHILASFLWIAPYSQNAREIVPGSQDTLTAYMIPFFGQSWSVFAPEPINGDYHFNVRATLADGSETGWVSATDVELSMIRYNLFPPRAGIQSSEVASSYKDAYDSVDDLQRTVAGGDFSVEDWEVGLRAALEQQAQPAEAPVEANDAEDAEDADRAAEAPEGEAAEEQAPAPAANTAEIEQLLAEERRSTAYATQVAKAIWGDEVEKVQFRVSRQNIIPFAERHNPHAQRPEPTVVLPGWRGPIVEEGQNEDNFADVFRGQFERITR